MVRSGAPATRLRHSGSSGSPSIREVMTRSAGNSATIAARLARWASVSRSAQLYVLDDQKARRDPARPLDQPGHRAPLALVARRVVHGVVEGPQLGRLRQVEQIVEKDGIIGRHQALGRRPFRHGLDSFGIACDVEAEKAPDEGADCVPSGAKVEHQAGVAGEARLARSVLELLDESRFTNARLAPNVDRLTPARLAAGGQRRHEQAKLALSTDEGRALTDRRRP